MKVMLVGGAFLVLLNCGAWIVLWSWHNPGDTNRRSRSQERAAYFISMNWESWSEKTIREREELILGEVQRYESDITIYTAEANDAYVIIIVPREILVDDFTRPSVFISRGNKDTLEQFRLEVLD